MNTKNLKAYAPKARSQFIEAVRKRAAQFGIYEGEGGKVRIEEVRVEGSAAIIEGRAFTRKEGEQRKRLESKVVERGYDMFIREMAYTWFNRLAALRYMEIHDYFEHGFRVLSHPTNSESLPEILNHASDVADSLDLDKSQIIELQLAGDKEEELYRELLLGQCHHLYKIMPFMFEAIDDATELLLPNNLTKTDSILKGLINDIPEEDWQEIEVIGWLYQFYISEHKDAVIGKVVKSEDIPAATQLFTPNWIVKYLVQNSVGRQWLATYPDSELKGKMEYYIEPAEQSEEVIDQLKAITPTSIDPEEVKVLDPACGSGHILVEVYEILREIYLERGYRLREIPELILTKNIYGLDIDDRAAQLAGFALMMKAREDDRRIFQRVEDGEVSLNVFSLQSTEHLDIPKLWKALDLEGNQHTGSTGGLFDSSEDFVQPTGVYKDYLDLLQTLKSAFIQAKTLGSLIQFDCKDLGELIALKEKLNEKIMGSDPAAKQAALEVLPIIRQALCLAQRYESVIANPPYMGSKGMNADLKSFAKKQFPNSKADLFAIFMERGFSLLNESGFNAQVNMQSWMFLSSYEKFRKSILENRTIVSLAHLGARAFSQISGEVVQTTAWVIKNAHLKQFKGAYNRLVSGSESEKRQDLLSNNHRFNNVEQAGFTKIPGSPIVYWLSSNEIDIFDSEKSIGDVIDAKQGLGTGNDDLYFRYHWEVDFDKLAIGYESAEKVWEDGKKWVPLNKGGSFRKWYGNQEFVISFDKNTRDVLKTVGNKLPSEHMYFKDFISWSDITSANNSFRYYEKGFLFSNTGHCAFPSSSLHKALTLLYANNKFVNKMTKVLNPTIHFHVGYFNLLPFPSKMLLLKEEVENLSEQLVKITKDDWDSSELSWNFKKNELLSSGSSIKSVYEKYSNEQIAISNNVLEKEIRSNQIFLDSYNLSSEIPIDIPLEEITLRKNKHFVFAKQAPEKRAGLIQCSELIDTISYATGCMMGRFSLDRKGLVYAFSRNDGFKELQTEGAYKSFPADDDGIIPLASEEWLFDDDATTRFKEFVKTVWGDEHLAENLEFVAESLCLHALKPKKGESAMDTIRRYFSSQFFKDHCKTYKKRPIYWLFSSGKEKAFECLVYLHRYNEGTLSRMRTEYVTPLMGKYDAQLTRLSEEKLEASGAEVRRIEKELKSLEKKQAELRTFDEQLKHYAEKRITLDLDDGVKANYGKFGNLLADVKAIHGKAVK